MPARSGHPRSPFKKMNNRNIDTLNLSKFCFAPTKGLLTLSKPELIRVIQCLQGKVPNPEKCTVAQTQTVHDHCTVGETQTDVVMGANPGVDVDVIPSVTVNTNGLCTSIKPYVKHPLKMFQHIDVVKLNEEINYSHNLGNRMVAHYGPFPYSYSNITHEPKEVPPNGTLSKIIACVRLNLPSIEFNSVMVNCYENGSKYIPYHADNERDIADDSTITTVSLGQTRTLVFRPTPTQTLRNPSPWTSTDLAHGDVLFMSKISQTFFQHGIHRSETGGLRISITLRQINRPIQSPLKCPTPIQSPSPTEGVTGSLDSCNNNPVQQIPDIIPQSQPAYSKTLYIASSMFAGLDPYKLSTGSQQAHVFSFPGATASGILSRLKELPVFLALEQRDVGRIVLMAGTNNVDDVVQAPKSARTQIISGHSICQPRLEEALSEIDLLVGYLSTRFPSTEIVMMNVLPRESRERNIAINLINYFISNLGNRYSNVSPIPAGKMNAMFCRGSGCRLVTLFSNKGNDNVHMNTLGLIRLAKYMKFLAHNGV